MVKNRNSIRINLNGNDMKITNRDNISIFYVPVFSKTTLVSDLSEEDFEKMVTDVKVFGVPVYKDISYTYYFGDSEEG